jgi:acyl transferase domain-containing protein
MASIGVMEEDAKKLLSEPQFAGKVQIAAVNSPNNVTISGNIEQVQQIVDRLSAQGTYATVWIPILLEV